MEAAFVIKPIQVSYEEMELVRCIQELKALLQQEYNRWAVTQGVSTLRAIETARTFVSSMLNAFCEDREPFLHFLACFDGDQLQNMVRCVRARTGSTQHEKDQARDLRRRFKNDLIHVIELSNAFIRGKDRNNLEAILKMRQEQILENMKLFLGHVQNIDLDQELLDPEVRADQPLLWT